LNQLTTQMQTSEAETFAEIIPPASGHMRLRISPDVTIALGVRVKRPSEGMRGEDVELILTEQATAFMPPYQRLLSDAMHGIGDLFGRQDIVDAQWRIVDPVLDDVVPPVTLTFGAGASEQGVVFKLSPSGTETVLHAGRQRRE
jgi:glucose-6-phosphate 1-dehydrogenase